MTALPRLAAVLAFACLCGAGLEARAQAVLEARSERVELWPHVAVLHDPTRAMDVERAAASGQFAPPTGAYATLGMGKDPIWLRIPYSVSQGGQGTWILDVGYALLDRVGVYVVSDGKVVRRALLGYDQPSRERPLPGRTHAVSLDFPAGSSGVILLHVEKTGARIVPVTLSRLPAFMSRALDEQLLQGAFACLALVLVLYSLAQWASLRDPLYFRYALVVLTAAALSLHLFGIGEMYLWTDWPWAQRRLAGVSAMLAAAASALFVADALGKDLGERLRKGLTIVAAIQAAGALAYAIALIGIEHVAVFMSTTGLAPALMGLPGAFAKARRGESVGYWFIAAWVGYFVTGAILVGVTTGRVDANFWTLHAFQIGTVVDMLIFMRITVLHSAERHREAQHAARERDRLHSLAHSDALTGLANRRGLDEALAAALAEATPERGVALCMLDLDGFKPINDQYGHEVGDRLLQALGQRLRDSVRSADVVARLGGDEFVVVAQGLTGEKQAQELARKLVQALREPFVIDHHTCQVGASVGYALAPRDGRDAAALLKVADAAMYAGKQASGVRSQESGRSQVAGSR
jgi:diguanylate cyclase (GGDEF)-like protein